MDTAPNRYACRRCIIIWQECPNCRSKAGSYLCHIFAPLFASSEYFWRVKFLNVLCLFITQTRLLHHWSHENKASVLNSSLTFPFLSTTCRFYNGSFTNCKNKAEVVPPPSPALFVSPEPQSCSWTITIERDNPGKILNKAPELVVLYTNIR